MTNQINSIVSMFAFYGFLACPLSRRKIASLLIRGFDKEQIYSIGCDSYCGAYPTR